MARPVNADPEETRARIITAAIGLFAHQGPSAVSMRSLAIAADTTAATLHHYFGNKDGLYAACVDAMYAQIHLIGTEIGRRLGNTEQPDALIPQAIRLAYDAACTHREVVRLVSRHVLDHGESAEPRRARAIDTFLTLADAYLGPLSPLGAADRRSMLYSFMLMFNRVVVLSPAEVARVYPADPLPDVLTRAFLRMLEIEGAQKR